MLVWKDLREKGELHVEYFHFSVMYSYTHIHTEICIHRSRTNIHAQAEKEGKTSGAMLRKAPKRC